jgi:hypothetical protein
LSAATSALPLTADPIPGWQRNMTGI